MNEELTINLKIANRLYPIKINRDDEEDIRKAANLINEVVLLYKEKYQNSQDAPISEQDYLACAITHLALKLVRFRKNVGDIGEVLSDFEDILEKD